MNQYVEYFAVVPYKDVFMAGETLQFLSDRVVYKESELEWRDILYCDMNNDGQFGYKDTYTSGDTAKPHPRRPLEQIETWDFNGKKITVDAICFLKSITALQLPYGIEKKTNTLFAEIQN